MRSLVGRRLAAALLGSLGVLTAATVPSGAMSAPAEPESTTRLLALRRSRLEMWSSR